MPTADTQSYLQLVNGAITWMSRKAKLLLYVHRRIVLYHVLLSLSRLARLDTDGEVIVSDKVRYCREDTVSDKIYIAQQPKMDLPAPPSAISALGCQALRCTMVPALEWRQSVSKQYPQPCCEGEEVVHLEQATTLVMTRKKNGIP